MGVIIPHAIILGTQRDTLDNLIDETEQAHTIIEGAGEGQYPNLEAKMTEIEDTSTAQNAVLVGLCNDIEALVQNPS